MLIIELMEKANIDRIPKHILVGDKYYSGPEFFFSIEWGDDLFLPMITTVIGKGFVMKWDEESSLFILIDYRDKNNVKIIS